MTLAKREPREDLGEVAPRKTTRQAAVKYSNKPRYVRRDIIGRAATAPHWDCPNDPNLDEDRLYRANLMAFPLTTSDGDTYGYFGGFDRQGKAFFFDVNGDPYFRFDPWRVCPTGCLHRYGFPDTTSADDYFYAFSDAYRDHAVDYDPAIGHDDQWLDVDRERVRELKKAEWKEKARQEAILVRRAQGKKDEPMDPDIKWALGLGATFSGVIMFFTFAAMSGDKQGQVFVGALILCSLVMLAFWLLGWVFKTTTPEQRTILVKAAATSYVVYRGVRAVENSHMRRQADYNARAMNRYR